MGKLLTKAEEKQVTQGEEKKGDNYVCIYRVGDMLEPHRDV